MWIFKKQLHQRVNFVMDRLDDLHRISRVYAPEVGPDDKTYSSARRDESMIVPPFLKLALSLVAHLEANDMLKERMMKLVGRKEFSNDPTEEMTEISTSFERTVNQVQRGLTKLVQFEAMNKELSSQPRQHLKAILQHLRTSMSAQVQEFKILLKAHSGNVQQRQQRVSRYGGVGPDSGSAGGLASLSQNYAMFSHAGPFPGPSPVLAAAPSSSAVGRSSGSTELRRRNNVSAAYSAQSTGSQQQVQMTRARYQQEESLRSAQKVESSLAQMGELFTQMSSLVMEQAETVLRIEDDVEAGLADTTEAHASMMKVYDITRGNRGVIIKVFLLLIFFIVLFLVLT